MSIDTFYKRESTIDLKEKLLLAVEQRINGEKSTSLGSVYNRMKERIDKL